MSDYSNASRSLQAVALLHGRNATMQWGFFPTITERLVKIGFEVVPIDLPSDIPSECVDHIHEALAPLHNHIIHFIGHSRGGALAQIVANERNITAERVVVWAGIGKWIRSRHDIGTARANDVETNVKRLDLVHAASGLRGRVLYLHAKTDLTVNEREIRHLVQQAENENALHVFSGSSHTFGITNPMTQSTGTFDAALTMTIGFLQS